MIQNGLFGFQESARRVPVGDLDLRLCETCGFTWNRSYDPQCIAYSDQYENCQTHSLEFLSYIDGRIDAIISQIPQDRIVTVVEMGCGQGDFLVRLTERLGPRVSNAVGFDPAWRGQDGTGPGATKIFRRRSEAASLRSLQITPDILVTRHTIEHVSDPLSFLSDIVAIAPYDRTSKVFIETPCNLWIQNNLAIQDLFYEHCSIFDTGSLARAMKKTGITPIRIDRVFGDQYLWAEGSTGPRVAIQTALNNFISHWKESLKRALTMGSIAVWGAGAKGGTFLNMCDPDASLVKCVVDVNPVKQSHFMPGTGHPVVSPDEAARLGIKSIYVMNPNYRSEITMIIERLSWTPDIHVLDVASF